MALPRKGSLRSLAAFFSFLYDIFNKQEALQVQYTMDYLNLIINRRQEERDKLLRDAGVVQYSSTNKLLMQDLENAKESVWSPARRTGMDV